jgi:hypothetical protein
MGAGQSTQRSTPNDAKNNLLWALDEAVHWEEEASIAQLLLSEASAFHPGQTSLGSISTLDNASRLRAIDLLRKTADLTYVRIDLLLKNGKTKLKDFPASHPARATLASRTFAAAATENLASNVESLVTNNPAIFTAASATAQPSRTSISQTASSSSSNMQNPATMNKTPVAPISGVTGDSAIIRNTEATVIEGPIDIKNTQTASPPALSAADISAGQAFTPEKLAQQERVELAAKFLFIYSLLTKTVACAQHTYKLTIRSNSLRKSLKPKRADKLDDVTVHSLRESQNRTDQALHLSLAYFDRAKSTLTWLRRDYEIAYAAHRCNELLRSGHKLRDTMTYNDDARANQAIENRMANTSLNTNKDDKFYDPKSENRYTDEIKQVDDIISSLQDRHQKLEHALQENERNALNVAFDYLDSNGRGEITHDQCPQLGDRLWRVLDTRAHGKITRANMMQGVDHLSRKIDDLHRQIMEIENDRNNTHHRSDLSHLKQEFRDDRTTLRQLNQYFYQYFVEAVFSDMDGSVRQETVDIATLHKDIKLLERALTSAVDPLSNLSTSRSVADNSGTGAANMIAQHKQVSQRAIDAHQQELVKEDRIIAGPTFTKAEAGVPGASMDKETHAYGTESRSANLGNTGSTGGLSSYPNDASIGTVHNSNYATAQQEPFGTQKTYDQSTGTIPPQQQSGTNMGRY